MSIVIPTYNEAQSIGLVLADIPAGMVEQVLVVDSDSTDGTAQIARQMGAEVVREPRRGYGRACLTGLATVNAPDVVVFLDGDYSDRPAEISRLLEPLREGVADIVIGSRLAGERMAGSMPWH
ncbi:MAG: glycosyltransferase family 2 protein, partial [Deltaproteobacteria bacterium]|nr:glycosyltransferase family 2 protein [Deltaproteobacteria bacterium]